MNNKKFLNSNFFDIYWNLRVWTIDIDLCEADRWRIGYAIVILLDDDDHICSFGQNAANRYVCMAEGFLWVSAPRFWRVFSEIFRGRLRRPEKNRGKNRVKPRRTHTNHGSLGGGGVKNSNNMGGFSLRPRGFSIRHRETEFFLGGTPKKTPHGNGKTSHIAWVSVFLL